ncbi:non-homologous end joining protein Ku [Teichococcus oryzae]|uniref:Non-homologous end joining protein Ku n=1 Tax=Teichococcus oryzae TaxID=1608942 RepID=A0A5B2TCD6_9PROT|nr:Ku protein [Pseudoroseomonas oryzae]KAA2211753.1 Ku protein [Pseudoroseomonas oryzae]
MSEARPLWHGTLRLALVSCPVRLLPAHHERNNLHFNMINPETGNRIRMVTVDAGTGKEVERRDTVRGYEFQKDEYVLLTDEDFESARIDSSRTLTIAKFVPRDSIDSLHFDAGYYLVPEGKEGQDVYAVLREALDQSGTAALSRMVLFRRERAVAIFPHGEGMLLHTLHEEGDIHPAADAFDEIETIRPEPEMVKLARQLIDRQRDRYDPADTEDRYEARLREVIDAKLRGEGVQPEAEEPSRGGNVIDLMAALKQSLGGGKAASAPAARAPRKAAGPRKSAGKPAKQASAKASGAKKTAGKSRSKPAAAPKRKRA